METQNRAFLEMLRPAKERLVNRNPADLAAATQIEYQDETSEFRLCSLGREITVHYPEYHVTPELNEWHCLLLLHYMDMADGTPLDTSQVTFGALKNGMVRGGGFDRQCEDTIRNIIGKKDPQEIQKACRELGADIIPYNADLCAVFPFFPRYPVTLNIWFADEEFEASGRMLLNASADHYLSVEDAVTVGSLILEELVKILSYT